MSSISGNRIRVERHRVNIKDDLVTPEGEKFVDDYIRKTVVLADLYRESLGITTPVSEIPRGRYADKKNWGLAYIINSVPGFELWMDTAATATTVATLYDPDKYRLPNGEKLAPIMRNFINSCSDGKGIRSRAEILSDLMSCDVTIDEKWLSLACGNAHPVLKAAAACSAKPQITLVDFSFDNLRFSLELAKERGLEKLIAKRLFRDLTYKGGFRKKQKIRKWLAPFVVKQRPIFGDSNLKFGYYDRAEACGFFEYLGPEAAARFIKRTFELLKPGGRFIFNNISDKHPQRAWTEGVIQWPFTIFRNVDEMVEIIRMSGVDLADDLVEVYEASDNVCLMFEIRKPK